MGYAVLSLGFLVGTWSYAKNEKTHVSHGHLKNGKKSNRIIYLYCCRPVLLLTKEIHLKQINKTKNKSEKRLWKLKINTQGMLRILL